MRYGVKSPSMEDSLGGALQAFREEALEITWRALRLLREVRLRDRRLRRLG
jgi:hypothetical protein